MDDFQLSGERTLSFLDLAEQYLKSSGRPLSAREIVTLAIQDGVLQSEGKTPWQTMKSKLSTDILNHGQQSRFKRVFQGVFALREAKNEEYQATRFIKNKLDEDIAVIPRTSLGKLIPRPGLWIRNIDRSQLTALSVSMRRREAEETFDVVQLISVFVVTYEGKFLTHMRSARLPESRLRGEYSMMLGGHVSVEDFAQLTLDLFDGEDLSDCTYILRELSEELILSTDPSVKPCGYLYDEGREVSKQHMGLVYLVTLPKLSFEIGERGFLLNAKMETLQEILERRDQFENWSWLLMDQINKLLES